MQESLSLCVGQLQAVWLDGVWKWGQVDSLALLAWKNISSSAAPPCSVSCCPCCRVASCYKGVSPYCPSPILAGERGGWVQCIWLWCALGSCCWTPIIPGARVPVQFIGSAGISRISTQVNTNILRALTWPLLTGMSWPCIDAHWLVV